jgi:hypothetical protein
MKTWIVGISALALLIAGAGRGRAADVTTKTLSIKDTDPAKRQISVSSADPGVTHAQADDPATNGATLHVYSATDDFCAVLPSGLLWKDTGAKWKFKDKATRNSAQVKDGKLSVKIKSGITYTLNEATQGTVNAQVQFGTGTKYCMHCTTAKKDEPGKYTAKACVAAACDPEPSGCPPPPTTTTTTTTTTSTTTTTCAAGTTPPLLKLKGALPATAGRFNYVTGIGLMAADNACGDPMAGAFPGTHACRYQELQAAAAVCDLVGLQATDASTVTSFWAIDDSAPPLTQCLDDGINPSFKNWEYQTAHTGSRGNWVALDNTHGALGMLQMGQQCNFTTKWVGCCVP